MWHAIWSLEYRFFLPGLARLPPAMARPFARWRGGVNAALKRDWRMSFAVDPDVHLRTVMAAQQLRPGAVQELVRARYRAQAEQEWLGARIGLGALRLNSSKEWPAGSEVLITAHYGGSIESAAVASQSPRLMLLTSNVVYRPEIPPALQAHYRKKYGRMLHHAVEEGLRPVLRHLKSGGSVVVVADLPAFTEEASCFNTPWGVARVAGGARWLAEASGRPLRPYVAIPQPNGTLDMRFGVPVMPTQDQGWEMAAYTQLAHWLFSEPEHWWAMDLLPLWFQPDGSNPAQGAGSSG